MAFYKYENDTLFVATRLIGPTYELDAALKDTYTYPYNGWTWFDKEKDAIDGLGVYIPDTTFTVVGVQAELDRDPTGDKFKVFDKFWKKFLKYVEKDKLDKFDEILTQIEDPVE